MLDFFTDLDFVRRRVPGHRPSVIVGIARNPSTAELDAFPHPGFELAGFDVVDTQFTASALLNGDQFPGVFKVSELSLESGLIRSRERAFRIRDTLGRCFPNRDEARCHVWAIWRYTGIDARD